MKTSNKVTEATETTEVPTPTVAVIALGTKNVSLECKIECVANPKRVGSKAHARYAAYGAAKSIGEYLSLGGLKADLRYDLEHQFLVLKEQVVEGKVIAVPAK